MKTLLFTLEYPPFKGGVANYYGNLAAHWPREEPLSILDNHQGRLLPRHGFLLWLSSLCTAGRKIRREKIDYVLVGQILPLGTVTWILSFFRSFKYAVFLHGMDFSYALKKPRKRFLSGLILKRADKIICANSYVARQVREFYPVGQKQIIIVNPGVSALVPEIKTTISENLKSRYNLTGKTVLLTLGRLVRRKGVDYTIKAVEAIPEPLLDNLIYFVIGAGPEEEALHRLVPPRFAAQIIFLGGELSDDEKWAWLNLCDIFIMPSRDIDGDFEGFGIVYLEANLCGRPVIAGDSGGVRDAVIDGYNGLLVDPEDVSDIKRAIMELATDADRRQQLGEQGRARVQKEFSWDEQTARLIAGLKNENL
jgi:phosphatidylinositol alpha-1,6-mannosyltransferase